VTLRPYQESFITNLSYKLASNRSVLAQLATGGGKTICFSAISKRYIDRNPDKSVLILVHRKELLQQTRRTLWNAYQITAQPIIAGMRVVPKAQVYIGMVESAHRRSERIHGVGLIIIDECHIASFTKIHTTWPDTMTIGFTATPLSSNKKKPLNLYYQDIVCGIDIADLITMGSLCQNITIAPRDTVARASLTIKNGEFDEGLMAMEFSKPKYIKNTVEAYLKYTPGTKALIFNITVAHSKLVCQAFNDAGLPARHIDGTTDPLTRTAALKWFADTPNGILCNVGIATTGFDEPTTETVVVNKATQAMPLWLQMCGRGSRPTPTKKMFHIIDMGANAITHGDWSQPRNWEDIFKNPPRAGKTGEGVAPVKVCPACDGIIPAQAMTCPLCGHEYPAKLDAPEEALGEFIVVTRGINVDQLIQQNKEHRKYHSFYAIGKSIAQNAKKSIKILNNDAVTFMLTEYQRLAEEWCHAIGKQYDYWHSEQAKKTLFDELKQAYPNWNGNNTPTNVTSLPDLKNLQSL